MKNNSKITGFLFGFILVISSLWYFFDSVRITVNSYGFISYYGHYNLRINYSSSMGLIFLPLVFGIIGLFYKYNRFNLCLSIFGLFVIISEMLSTLRFHMNMKSSHFILILLIFSAGIGILLKNSNFKNRDLND